MNSWVMVFFYFLYPVFLEQSALFSLYLESWMTKNHEKIVDNSRVQYISLIARITLIAILVMEIQKSQDDASMLFGIWSSFYCLLFSIKLTVEFGKVLYKEIVEGFLPLHKSIVGMSEHLDTS